MGKASKATKKFQNKHLKHTIEHRREVQKQNKKMAQRRGKGNGSGPAEPKEKKSTRPIFDDMSVDEFFEGGFEVPKAKKGANAGASEEGDEEVDDEDEEVDEDEDDEEDEEEDEEEEDDEEAEDASSSEEEDEEMMKKDMAALETKDPEFFNYLKNNEKELLDFEGVNPLDAMSEDESDESDEEDAAKTNTEKPEEPKRKKIDISKKLVAKWDQQLKGEPNAKTIQNVISAFKTVVYINSSDEKNETRYTFNDPDVFNDLMFVGLRRVPEAVQKLAPYKVNSRDVRAVDSKNKNSRVVGRLMKTQAGAYITLLQDITNTETAALVLASLQEVLPFYISQRKVLKQIFTAVVDVWASTTNVETQVSTYAFLNNAAREFPKSTLDIILRTSYSSFLKNCKKTNIHTMDSINFAKNSAAELFGIDESLSYSVGFEFVRQLAVHLRNTISSTSNASASSGKDAYKSIYNWQFCHSLDFWSRVLAKQCNPEKELVSHKSHESPLRPLIYPLVQVTLGAIRLIPTAQFFPLRFYLIRSLIRLSQGSGVYIPVFPLIFEILTSTAFTKPPKNASLPAVDFEYIIKVNQQYLGTKAYQDGLCDQFLELTSEFLVLYCKNIAFPELVTPVILSLRRFMKKSKNIKFNKQIQQLVEKLNTNANYITAKRSGVEYGPSNKAEVSNFLKEEKWESTPLGQYVVVHRNARDEKAKILKEAVVEEEKAKEAKKKADIQMEDAIIGGDEEDEDLSLDEEEDEQ
ncbi:hypothetical protein JCM33374_g1451 [Metschnikowia sp. JCM 33374]|nr:hypothetical protein JCM33374_g1451 [Metschnikowia sp. JCM 33374]